MKSIFRKSICYLGKPIRVFIKKSNRLFSPLAKVFRRDGNPGAIYNTVLGQTFLVA